jgi:hypothetical protein
MEIIASGNKKKHKTENQNQYFGREDSSAVETGREKQTLFAGAYSNCSLRAIAEIYTINRSTTSSPSETSEALRPSLDAHNHSLATYRR